MLGILLRPKMKRQIILISIFLALTVTVNAGLAFDDKQDSNARKDGNLHKSGADICSSVEIALGKTGKAIEKAGNKTGQALKIAAAKTSQALTRAGKKIQGWFDDKQGASK